MPGDCQPQDALAPPGGSDDPAADPLADALTPQGSRCGRNVQRVTCHYAILYQCSAGGNEIGGCLVPHLIPCCSLRLGGYLCSSAAAASAVFSMHRYCLLAHSGRPLRVLISDCRVLVDQAARDAVWGAVAHLIGAFGASGATQRRRLAQAAAHQVGAAVIVRPL